MASQVNDILLQASKNSAFIILSFLFLPFLFLSLIFLFFFAFFLNLPIILILTFTYILWKVTNPIPVRYLSTKVISKLESRRKGFGHGQAVGDVLDCIEVDRFEVPDVEDSEHSEGVGGAEEEGGGEEENRLHEPTLNNFVGGRKRFRFKGPEDPPQNQEINCFYQALLFWRKIEGEDVSEWKSSAEFTIKGQTSRFLFAVYLLQMSAKIRILAFLLSILKTGLNVSQFTETRWGERIAKYAVEVEQSCF